MKAFSFSAVKSMTVSILCATVAFLAVSSCSKGESGSGGGGDTPSGAEKIELKDASQSSLVFTDVASSKTVAFSSSGNWTAALSDDRASGWCSVSPASGSAGDNLSVTVSVTQSTETEDRTATVVLTCGSKSVKVAVTQKYPDALTLTQSTFNVKAFQDTITVEAKSNLIPSFVIDETCKGWIKSVETKGLSSTFFKFAISENEGDKREGKIKFTAGSKSEVVTVYQEGYSPSIVVSRSEIPVGYEGGEVKIDVRHNVAVTMNITSGSEWLSENKTKAFSTTSYSFTALRNDGDPRTATVEFTNAENGLREVVKVTQVQKNSIVVAPSSVTVAQGGETVSFQMTRNVDYAVSIDCDWIKNEGVKSFITENIYFSVSANENYEGRSGTITFTSPSDATISQKVVVFQNQKDAIVLGETTKQTSFESDTFSVTIKSNVDVEVSIPAEAGWIHEIEGTKGGLTENTIYFLLDENNGSDERKAELTFSNFQAGITQKYLVLQGAKPTVVVGDIYNVTAKGGTIDIQLSSNLGTYSVEVESSASSWLRYIGTKAPMRTDIVTFEAAENDKYETRMADISIKDAIGTVVKTFIIKQNAKPIPTFEIWYSTKAGYTLKNVPETGWGTGVSLRENIVVDNHCVLRFDGDVICIPSSAFKNQTTLISMTLPESVTSIGQYAFSGCTSMSDVTIPSEVSSVGTGAFAGFAGTAYINSSKLPSGTFAGTDIVCASFGDGVTAVTEKAFYDCKKLAYVTFPNTVTSIGDYAFAKCNFTTIILPSSLRTLGKGVFSDCVSLKSASMTDTLTTMGTETFSGCTALETLILPLVMTIIPDRMCYHCSSLLSIIIPEGVKSIGRDAFCGCKLIPNVTLPATCTSIGNYAFSECAALTTITCGSKKAVTLGSSVFYKSNKLRNLYVPEGSEGAYHDIWGGTVYYINGIYTYFLRAGNYEYRISDDSTQISVTACAVIDSTSECPYSVPEGGITFGKSYSSSLAIKKEPWTGKSYSCEKVCVPDKDGYIYWRPYVKINGGIWQAWGYQSLHINVPQKVILNRESFLATVGTSFQIIATVEPSGAVTGNVIWYSSNETVAKVAKDGTVTCLKKGEALISYKMQYKGMSASCRVTVTNSEGDNEKTEEIDLDL